MQTCLATHLKFCMFSNNMFLLLYGTGRRIRFSIWILRGNDPNALFSCHTRTFSHKCDMLMKWVRANPFVNRAVLSLSLALYHPRCRSSRQTMGVYCSMASEERHSTNTANINVNWRFNNKIQFICSVSVKEWLAQNSLGAQQLGIKSQNWLNKIQLVAHKNWQPKWFWGLPFYTLNCLRIQCKWRPAEFKNCANEFIILCVRLHVALNGKRSTINPIERGCCAKSILWFAKWNESHQFTNKNSATRCGKKYVHLLGGWYTIIAMFEVEPFWQIVRPSN